MRPCRIRLTAARQCEKLRRRLQSCLSSGADAPSAKSRLRRSNELQPQRGRGGRTDDAVHLQATGTALERLDGGFGLRAEDSVDHQIRDELLLVESARSSATSGPSIPAEQQNVGVLPDRDGWPRRWGGSEIVPILSCMSRRRMSMSMAPGSHFPWERPAYSLCPIVRADVWASRRLMAAQHRTNAKYCASGQFLRCGAVGLVPLLAHSIPIKCQFPMLVGSHGYMPIPACQATPTATTVTVPSRAMCSWDSGPGEIGTTIGDRGRAGCVRPGVVRHDAPDVLEVAMSAMRQPGYSTRSMPSARRTSASQTGSPVHGPVCAHRGTLLAAANNFRPIPIAAGRPASPTNLRVHAPTARPRITAA